MFRWLPWRALQNACILLLSCTLFGLALRPWNQHALELVKQEGLLPEAPTEIGDDALSQQLALFTLGGLRSLASQILSLDATAAWMKQDWPRVERRFEQMTTLCPKRVNYWMNASYEMATNAAAYDSYLDRDLDEMEQAQRRYGYFLRGERFLKDGIRHNPDSSLLYSKLGDLHSNLYRYPRFLQASEAYKKAVALGASPLYERMVFYALCRVHGKEQEAWELGRTLFEKYPDQRVPTLICLLFVLENKLKIPQKERLSIEQLFGSEERAKRLLTGFARNTLLHPTTGIKSYLEGK